MLKVILFILLTLSFLNADEDKYKASELEFFYLKLVFSL